MNEENITWTNSSLDVIQVGLRTQHPISPIPVSNMENITSYVTTSLNNVNVTHVFERLTWTQFLLVHSPLALHVDRAVTPIWYVIGIIGNTLSAKIWMEKRMRQNNSSAIYLATLSVTDMIFLLLHVLLELKYAWGKNTLGYPAVCEGYFMVYLVAQYLSPLLVLGFTVERWIAVCHPFKKEKYCTSSRAKKVCAGLIVLCLLLCSTQAYFWTFDGSDCTMRVEATQGGDASFWSIWTWATEMLVFLLVPLVILIFNILVIREVRKMSKTGRTFIPGQQKNNGSASAATTVMLLSVSFYVICTTLPATLVYALVSQFPEGDIYMTDEQIDHDPHWQSYLYYLTCRKIVEEICLSHYACNFFLYLITGVHFRKSLLEIFKYCRLRIKSGGKYSEISQRTTWHNTVTTKV